MKSYLKPKRLCLLLATLMTFSAVSQADNLMDIYQLALENDNQLKADRASYEAGMESITIGRAGLLPQVNVDLGWDKSDSDKSNNLNSGIWLNQNDVDQEQTSWGVSLSQPLFDMRAWHAYQQGSVLSELSTAQFSADQQSLIIRVADSYFNVLRRVDDLETALAEEKALSHQWQQTKQRFEVGLTAVTDVHEARAAYDSATANSLETKGMLGISYEQLEVITGTAHDKIAPLKGSFPVTDPVPAERHKWVEFALDNNYSLKVAQLQSQASHQNAKAKKAGHYPTLSANASYRESTENGRTQSDLNGFYRSSSPFDTDTEGEFYSLSLNVPIFSGMRVSGERRQAQGQYLQAQELSYLAQRNTIQQARSRHLGVVTNVARVNARQQAIVSSNSAMEATQAGYEVGTRNLVDVLNVQRNLYQAKRNYSEALYDYVIGQLKLKQVAGNLTPADVKLLSQSLDNAAVVSRAAYGA